MYRLRWAIRSRADVWGALIKDFEPPRVFKPDFANIDELLLP
jgi:hypothetical protein